MPFKWFSIIKCISFLTLIFFIVRILRHLVNIKMNSNDILWKHLLHFIISKRLAATDERTILKTFKIIQLTRYILKSSQKHRFIVTFCSHVWLSAVYNQQLSIGFYTTSSFQNRSTQQKIDSSFFSTTILHLFWSVQCCTHPFTAFYAKQKLCVLYDRPKESGVGHFLFLTLTYSHDG